MYDARAVANQFLALAAVAERPLDPLKIQKLVYLAHGWHLAVVGTPLIQNEIRAWKYGPVIPDLYFAFRRFGGSPITEPISGFDNLVGSDPVDNPEASKCIIDAIWSTYGELSGVQLSSLTHQPQTPWFEVWNNCKRQGEDPIPNSLMKQYFERELGCAG